MIKSLKSSLYHYWQFLKKPKLLKISADKKGFLPDFLTLLLIDLLFVLLIGAIHGVLLHYKLVNEYEDFDYFKQFGFWGTMLLAVIAAPLIEECIFRWQLRKQLLSIYFMFISAGLLICSFTKSDYARFFILIFALVLAMLVHGGISKLERRMAILIWRKYYVFLFYFTAIIFGYVHYTNIKGLTPADPMFIFYIVSQIFTGISLGYLRVKYGLIYAILFHAGFNLIAITVAWFCKN